MSNPTALDATRRALVADKVRAAKSSVAAGFLLTVMKLAAGLGTGSLGLLAEAAHSLLDFGAAALTLFAVRASWRPPDREHLYGHGKVENLAALGETILLALTSVWILYEAAERLLGRGPEVEPSLWAFAVMGVSIVVDLVRSRDLARVARRSGSQALEADALHFSTDVASSAVVIVGLVGVWLADLLGARWLGLADPLAASVVAVIILVLSWQLGRRTIDMLLDRAPSGMLARIENSLGRLAGIEEASRVRVRQGGDQVFVDIELPLGGGLPVAEGERVAAAARSLIRAELGEAANVSVQIVASERGAASIRDRVAVAVAMEGLQAHNITVRENEHGRQADFHLELPSGLSLSEGHALADRVEQRVLREVPELGRVDSHIELRAEDAEPACALDPARTAAYEQTIHAVAREVVGESALHDVLLTTTRGGLYLSCHCFVPPGTPLVEAHALTERLERRLRWALPELKRVAVHAEPAGLHD